jgi:hypothetical protein
MDPITVRELISILEQFDPSLRVVVDGYEGGFDYPLDPEEIEIVEDVNTESYYGAHDWPSNAEEKDRAIRALRIGRP